MSSNIAKRSTLKRECVQTRKSEINSVCKKVSMDTNGLRYQTHHDQSSRKSSADANGQQHRSNSSSLRQMMSDSISLATSRGNTELLNSSSYYKKGVRFIRKSGHCNVSHTNLSDKPKRFISDIFTTGVDLKWRWNLFVFGATFVVSWISFGAIFWLSSYIHGDFDLANHANETFKPCVNNLDPKHAFTSAFLFSLETQTTIGYGFRVVTEECPFTVLMVVFQSVFGGILDAFMIGLIMAKISRPKKRAETLLFSKNAVINVRDGKLCLMIRVGNLRKSHLVEATIRMQFIHSRETLEGEFIPLEQIDLALDLKNDSDRLFLVTPQTICHPIDEDSPLWQLHPDNLNSSNFEVIAILEGMVEATGMTTQARASYLPEEILWGHRFHNMISFTKRNGYKVNFRHFNQTYCSPDAPWQSAKALSEARRSSDMRSMIESANMYRNKSSDDETSSNRSSVRFHPSNASEGRDSGYTAVEDLPRTGSLQTLNADHSKPLTSTTSLSDDAEDEATPTNRPRHLALTNNNLTATTPLSPERSTSKPQEAVLVNIDETTRPVQVLQRASASFKRPKTQRGIETGLAAKSSDDIRLLLLDADTPQVSATQSPAAQQQQGPLVMDKRFDESVDLTQHGHATTLCV